MDSKNKKKIQFSVPVTIPSHLDPHAVEMIRRRRPTPATLFRVSENSPPEEESTTHQWVMGENGVLKPKRPNPCVYRPPSVKGRAAGILNCGYWVRILNCGYWVRILNCGYWETACTGSQSVKFTLLPVTARLPDEKLGNI
ncbi:protein phosphatase 1 regulatory subunit 1B-like [Polyodon spathula]|uniref:protein phosphatase 1 regulatory subunit 1B-like n=1 Tax=Polyodon spathula TaxID=7913 RepID=UPI001B7F4EB4|nr:protein phosphatase 1 regulatory subunit 1B-like [Polyodon spathula]